MIMGQSRFQKFPKDIHHEVERVTSHVTVFLSPEVTVTNNSESDMYEIIPLEELEVGLITEVSTTSEDEDNSAFQLQDSSYLLNSGGPGENEMESDRETSTCPSVVNPEILVDGGENREKNLDSNETLHDVMDDLDNDDFLMSWLSSLNSVATANETEVELLESPVADETTNDQSVAKEELRSFILARKMRTDEDQSSVLKRKSISDYEDVESPRRKTKTNYDELTSEELRRHRRRQERNRIAARKCRQKQSKLAEELTNESESLRKQNEMLASEVKDLTSELRMLQDIILNHDLHMTNSKCSDRMSTLLLDQALAELL